MTLLSEPNSKENSDELFFLFQTLYNGGLLILFNNPRVDWHNEQEADGAAFVATLGVSKVITRKFVEVENTRNDNGDGTFDMECDATSTLTQTTLEVQIFVVQTCDCTLTVQ